MREFLFLFIKILYVSNGAAGANWRATHAWLDAASFFWQRQDVLHLFAAKSTVITIPIWLDTHSVCRVCVSLYQPATLQPITNLIFIRCPPASTEIDFVILLAKKQLFNLTPGGAARNFSFNFSFLRRLGGFFSPKFRNWTVIAGIRTLDMTFKSTIGSMSTLDWICIDFSGWKSRDAVSFEQRGRRNSKLTRSTLARQHFHHWPSTSLTCCFLFNSSCSTWVGQQLTMSTHHLSTVTDGSSSKVQRLSQVR